MWSPERLRSENAKIEKLAVDQSKLRLQSAKLRVRRALREIPGLTKEERVRVLVEILGTEVKP